MDNFYKWIYITLDKEYNIITPLGQNNQYIGAFYDGKEGAVVSSFRSPPDVNESDLYLFKEPPINKTTTKIKRELISFVMEQIDGN